MNDRATRNERDESNGRFSGAEWETNIDAGGVDLANLGGVDVDHVHTSAREADVVVWKDDDGVFHADGTDERIASGTAMLDVIQAAVDGLSDDRTTKERVLVASAGTVGPVDELTQVVLPSHTVVDVPAQITVEDEGESLVIPFRALGETDIEIPRLSIAGNPRFGLVLQNCDRVTLGDVRVRFRDLDALDPYEDHPDFDPPDSFPPSHDPDRTRDEQLADPVHVGQINEGIRLSGRAREADAEDIQLRSAYVENARHHAVETYDTRRVQIGRVLATGHGGSSVLLNGTTDATVDSVVGDNPSSPSLYATFRCANGCRNVTVGQIVSRDAPRGIHITTDSNDVTIGRATVIGAKDRGVKIDDVENVTLQGGLIKNVTKEAILSTGDGVSVSDVRITDDRPPTACDQTYAIVSEGTNGRFVDNDVRNGGAKGLIEADSPDTIVRDNVGDGVDSGTVTLESGSIPAARVADVSDEYAGSLSLRAEFAAAPTGPVAWTHRFEWTGDAWDLVVEWETVPDDDLELHYIVDRTRGTAGPLTEADASPVTTGTYRIRARHTDLSLAVDGSDVVQDEWSAATEQRWTVDRLADGTYRIAADDGRVLEVADASSEEGAVLSVGEDVGAPHQRWEITPLLGGRYRIEAVHSGRAATVAEWGRAPGTRITQRSFDGTLNQQFRFDRL
ncbi:RICIN domain-containing protein [Natrinema amylolyticum]|uniref:RICIN domain-containing protein n=1 Tax=Natrinema amylolyticum TaxID=2878679 RepID=UPI001CFA90EE|nr:RICIN domain-containing protein [Natrinema amylolyticum]